MCGIAGAAVAGMSADEIETLSSGMIENLKRRGPDGHGHVIEDNILLCHTRLAIQDLSPAGSQPMYSASGRYVITFNGEIYNFEALRAECLSLGAQFRGHSDTEVLLTCIDLWGVEPTLVKCKGMFAFALLDKKVQTLTLARDRFGEKPLYYGQSTGRFFFCSELKACRPLNGKFRLNQQAIEEFLAYGYIPTPMSIFESVYKLPPAHYLSLPVSELEDIDFERHRPVPYWKTSRPKNFYIKGDEDLVIGELKSLLSRSIGEQLVADVPVGTFLSGGIDSTLVTAIAQATSSKSVKTFTIGFDSAEFNEAVFARDIAKHLGTEHSETILSGNAALDIIDSLSEVYDEPFADPSQIPSILLAQVAKKEVTVCLSGDGGDEFFCGYNRYLAASKLWNLMRWIPFPVRKMLSTLILTSGSSTLGKLYKSLLSIITKNGQSQANVAKKIEKLANGLVLKDKAELYDKLLHLRGPEADTYSGSEHIIRERVKDFFSREADFIDAAMAMDQANYLCDDNLQKVDRSAMFSSLETRLPLLSTEIGEFSWQMESSIKHLDGKSKWPLRELLKQYVPTSLTDRPKMGFSVPLAQWLRHDLRDWSQSLLEKDFLSHYLDVDSYRQLWDRHQTGVADHSLDLWPALILSHWIDAWREHISDF